jgi:hypothetical protein
MGDAAYTYIKTKDGCEIRIDSRRAIQSGANISINGCDVTVSTGALDAPAQRDLALFTLLNNILPVTIKESINVPNSRPRD